MTVEEVLAALKNLSTSSRICRMDREELDRARAAVAELASEVERLRTRLNDEENAHAELQVRCFDNGQPSFGSIFDERDALRRRVEELEREIASQRQEALAFFRMPEENGL